MKVLIHAATNIGKIAKRIQNDLNAEESESRYSVTPIEGSPGIVRVTDHQTGNSRSIKLKYELKARKRTTPTPWSSSYHADQNGNVFDNDGNKIGTLQVIPSTPNKEGKCRNYIYDGMINTSPDSWQEVNEKNIGDIKSLLS